MKSEILLRKTGMGTNMKGNLFEYIGDPQQVVLCTGEGDRYDNFSGVVIHNIPDGHHVKGDYSRGWLKDKFRIFNGEIKLKQ